MAHYTFPPGAAETVSGVTLPEYVVEAGRAAYAFDDATTEGIMFTVPNLPNLSGDMNYQIIGYASGTSGTADFQITPYNYSPSDSVAEGSWLAAASAWGSTSAIALSAATDAAYQVSKATLAYTPVTAVTDDYFAFKLERVGSTDDVDGDFRIIGVTLTF